MTPPQLSCTCRTPQRCRCPWSPPPGPTASELLLRLQGALELPPEATEALALWMSSPLLAVQLKPRHRPLRLARRWPELLLVTPAPPPDEPCLQLRRNVFFPKSRELESEVLLRLLYEDARGQVLGGLLPMDPPQALALGALSCRLRLGPFQPGLHTARSIRMGDPMGPSGRANGSQWGTNGSQWESPMGEPMGPPIPPMGTPDTRTPALQSQQPPWTPPRPPIPAPPKCTWGGQRGPRTPLCPPHSCAFFPGAIERPPGGLLGRGGLRPVTVAVGLEGVTIIDSREKVWGVLWGRIGGDEATGPPQLWLEFDGEHEGAPVNRLLRVFSPQAELMSALIECCIELGGAGPEQAPPPDQAPPTGGPAPEPPSRGSAPLRPRLQRLATIDYVQDGERGGGGGGGGGGGIGGVPTIGGGHWGVPHWGGGI
uniref:FERM central domain-containing protein n=1 Tax=Melopsittacus undulatus TaxID=13146 RepID=A0A8V5GD98_MELUD